MKRTMLVLVCVVMTVLMFAGCGDGGLEFSKGDLPGIISITPENGAVGVDPNCVVTIVFAGPVPQDLVDYLTIRVTNAEGEVAGTVAYDEATYTATFTPAYQFTLTALHTISIAAEKQNRERDNIPPDITSTFTVRDGSWEGSFRLSSESSIGIFSDIAFNSNGNAMAVWIEIDTVNKCCLIKASHYVLGGSWSEPEVVAELPDDKVAHFTHVALDSSGNGLAVWEDVTSKGKPYAARYEEGKGWSSPVSLYEGDEYSYGLQLTMNSSGHAAALWLQEESEEIFSARARYFDPVTGWGDTHTLDTQVQWLSPSLVIAPSGHVTAVWGYDSSIDRKGLKSSMFSSFSKLLTRSLRETNFWSSSFKMKAADEPSYDEIRSSRFDPDTNIWSSPVRICQSDSYGSFLPKVVSDRDGNALCVWVQMDEKKEVQFWTNRYTAGTGWEEAERLDVGESIYVLGELFYAYDLAMNASGQAAFVFSHVDFDKEEFGIATCVYTPGEGWSNTGIIMSDEESFSVVPTVTVDDMGNAHVCWQDLFNFKFDSCQTKYMTSRYTPANGWGPKEEFDSLFSDSFNEFQPIVIKVDPFGNAAAIWFEISLDDSDSESAGVMLNMFR